MKILKPIKKLSSNHAGFFYSEWDFKGTALKVLLLVLTWFFAYLVEPTQPSSLGCNSR